MFIYANIINLNDCQEKEKNKNTIISLWDITFINDLIKGKKKME